LIHEAKIGKNCRIPEKSSILHQVRLASQRI